VDKKAFTNQQLIADSSPSSQPVGESHSLLGPRELRRSEKAAEARAAKQRKQPPITIPKGLLICGVDEAGRGPLAGPVYAAAVVLNPKKPIPGLADSKVLSAKQRERLFIRIQTDALSFGIASASVEEIDLHNILQATFLAMQRAVDKILVMPDEVWIDGNRCPQLRYTARAVVKGDARVASISAASILAKTARDAQLLGLSKQFPHYGWETNMGYPTPDHLAALKAHGVSPWHRKSFAPVKAQLVGTFTSLL
jgi:ribonuclease HII